MVRRSARIQYTGAPKRASSDLVTATATVAKQAIEIKKLKTELKKHKRELKENRDNRARQETLELENLVLGYKCEALEENQANQLLIFKKKLEDHKKNLTEKMTSVEVRVAIKEELEEERKEVEELREKCLDLMKKQSNEAIGRNGEPFAWQICSICLERFTEEYLHTPRVLKCGHTFCLGCIFKFCKSDSIKCPICREQMWCTNPSAVPKNFMIADVSK